MTLPVNVLFRRVINNPFWSDHNPLSFSSFKTAALFFLAFTAALPAGRLLAQLPLSPATLGDQEYRRQQELERQRREKRGEEAPDIHFKPGTAPEGIFGLTVCFFAVPTGGAW